MVFTHEEATRVLSFMDAGHKLAASLMYGSGLRVMEAVRLRVQDVDFAQGCLFVREAEGDKWRRTLLPRSSLSHCGRKSSWTHVIGAHERGVISPLDSVEFG